MTPWTFTVPGLQLVSEANAHTHWRERQRRAKRQRGVVAAMLGKPRRASIVAMPGEVPLPAIVTITRIAPRALDSDNAVGACKHVRDQVAEWLGVDDRSPLVEWRVTQERGAPRTYAVRIRVEAVPQ